MPQLDNIIKSLNKKSDIPVISKGIPKRNWNNIPFSSPNLNWMTYGGIPKGTVIEFAGEENGGKTTTALDLVANAQKLFHKEYIEEMDNLIAKENQTKEDKERLDYLYERGEQKVVYCDCENTLDEDWAKTIGVNTEELILLKPMAQSAEEILIALV